MCDRVCIYYIFIQFNTHSDRANCVAASSLLPTSSGSESRRLQINASGPSELGMIRGALERCTGAFKWSNLFSISPSPLELCESESATNALAVVLKPGQILFLLLTTASSYGAPKRAAVDIGLERICALQWRVDVWKQRQSDNLRSKVQYFTSRMQSTCGQGCDNSLSSSTHRQEGLVLAPGKPLKHKMT